MKGTLACCQASSAALAIVSALFQVFLRPQELRAVVAHRVAEQWVWVWREEREPHQELPTLAVGYFPER
jgi:hypothetical protein